ncbi:MAG TPA: HD domain-containing protein [Caproiciproducens sp.]|nr:HD domain-containing protein [Caproiciproducens sp.]
MALTPEEKQYFNQCAADLLKSPSVLQMKKYIQHADISCLEHSVSVAYYAFALCRRLNMNVDCKSLIRGALLHDFFLYDWHKDSEEREGLHAFTHPKTALKNAEERFPLNDIERDIIVKHMWPLTLTPPKYRETFLVTLSDKFCSVIETLRIYPKYISRS